MVLRLLVDIRFQVLFHSPPGVLFTFPSRYYALSVANEYFALEGGPPCFPQGFTCPVVLWILDRLVSLFAYRAFTFYGLPFQVVRLSLTKVMSSPQPQKSKLIWFGLFPVRSPLLRESRLITFPPGT